MEFQRNGLSPSIYAEVEIYLRGRVEYLVEKVNRDREKVAVPIPVKPKVKPKVNMDDIMAKVNSIVKPLGDIPEVKKPVMHAQTFNTPPPPIDIWGWVSRVFDPDSQ